MFPSPTDQAIEDIISFLAHGYDCETIAAIAKSAIQRREYGIDKYIADEIMKILTET